MKFSPATLLFLAALTLVLCLLAHPALAGTSDEPDGGIGTPVGVFAMFLFAAMVVIAAAFMLAVFLLASFLALAAFGLGAAFTSSVYALIRRRWSALPRAFVVQMSALVGALFCAATLRLADWYWQIGWSWQADLIVGAAVGLILGILFGMLVNAIVSRIWRWLCPPCESKLEPAAEAKRK